MVLALAAPGGGIAHAQEIYDFDIERADLASVVTAIARTSGTAVSFPAELARGRMAGPIHTRASTQAALNSALAGTGLEAVEGAGGGLTIRPVGAGTASATIAGDVEAIDVTDVSGGQNNDQGFKAGNAGDTVRIGDAPIKEIPISVSAVTEEVIESQSVTSVGDVVRNVAGVTVLDSGTTGRPTFQVRGFDAGDDGYTVNGNQGVPVLAMPIDSIERVEVLKGPTSILTGKTAEGGVVNVVLKQPTEERIREVTARYGTDGKKSLALDMGGVVPGTEGFTYRFVGSGLHMDETEAGYVDPHEFQVFPSLKWTGEALTVLASLNYVKSRIVKSGRYATLLEKEDDETGLYTRELYYVPEGRGFGNPKFHDDVDSLTLNSEQSYDFGAVLGGVEVKFDNTFEYTEGDNKGSSISLYPGEPGSTIFFYATSYSEQDIQAVTERPSMTLTYDGDLAKSVLKVGYDYQKYNWITDSIDGPNGDIDVSTGEPSVPLFEGIPIYFQDAASVSHGVYAVEKLDLFDNRLHILASYRQDWYIDSLILSAEGMGTYLDQESKIDGPSYVLGAAWDITEDLTAYVNHSDGFKPRGMYDGRPIPPEGRTLYEAGLRYSMFDDRFSITTSVYDLTQTNMTLFDRSTDPVTFITTKGQRSRGIEVEAQGEVLPGWNLIASATALNAESLDDETGVDPTSGNPKYQGSLWTTYTIQEGSTLEGFTFGAGVRAVSKSQVNIGSDGSLLDLEGYMVADALVGYQRGDFSADLKINNIFDEDAIQPTSTSGHMSLESGRSWLLTARYKF